MSPYSQDDFDPDASVRFGVDMRTIVNLVEKESGLEIHNPWNWCKISSAISVSALPSERCFSDPGGYASSEGGLLTIDLGHGEFIGSINSENNRVDGQVYSYPESDLTDMHTVVHSSQGGMVKLSDIPSLPYLSGTSSTWGVIDYSDAGSLPLHGFIESTMLIEYLEAGQVVRTEQIYDMKAGSIQLVSLGTQSVPPSSFRSQFGFSEYIQAANSAEYSEGWYVSTLSNNFVGSSSELSGGLPESSSLVTGVLPEFSRTSWGGDIPDQAPLVSITNASEIIGNVSVTDERVIEMNGSFIAGGEETFTIEIFVDLD